MYSADLMSEAEAESEPTTPAREDLTHLLNNAVDVAVELLSETGEFDPFAIAMRENGDMVQIAPEEESGDLDADEVVEKLYGLLKRSRAEYKAIAIVADVTLEDEEDEPMTAAISVSLEHIDDEPINCYVPYEITDKDEIELGDLLPPEAGERQVFFADPPN